MSQDAMRELAMLAQQLRDAQAEAGRVEQAMKDASAKVRRLSEEDIPGLMSELGMKKFVLESGETISCALEVYASITEEKRAAAHAWLEQNGFGALIDTVIGVKFDRKDREKALTFAAELEEQGLAPELMERVHASRLKSFLKERLAAGDAVPLELFGARPVTVAKLK